MEGAFQRISGPAMSGFSVRFPFSFWPSIHLHLSRVHLERWGGGKCIAVAFALSFFHSESGGCFRGLQKCVRKRLDGAVESAKNGRLEKVDLGSSTRRGLDCGLDCGLCT